MTDVLIKRELLEDLRDAANDCLNHEIMRGNDRNVPAYTELVEQADAALSAPRQPEGEGLEVVAWQDAENPLYTTAERRVLHDWANNGYPIVELCRLSDHLRAIAELDRKVWEWSSAATAEAHRVDELKAERDTLRQQRNKMVGLLMEADASFVDGSEAGLELSDRIHSALSEVSK